MTEREALILGYNQDDTRHFQPSSGLYVAQQVGRYMQRAGFDLPTDDQRVGWIRDPECVNKDYLQVGDRYFGHICGTSVYEVFPKDEVPDSAKAAFRREVSGHMWPTHRLMNACQARNRPEWELDAITDELAVRLQGLHDKIQKQRREISDANINLQQLRRALAGSARDLCPTCHRYYDRPGCCGCCRPRHGSYYSSNINGY